MAKFDKYFANVVAVEKVRAASENPVTDDERDFAAEIVSRFDRVVTEKKYVPLPGPTFLADLKLDRANVNEILRPHLLNIRAKNDDNGNCVALNIIRIKARKARS